MRTSISTWWDQCGQAIASQLSRHIRRKHGLPFESRGQAVSVMAIEAIGTITENLNDGKRVNVEWTKSSWFGNGTSTPTGGRSGASYQASG